MAQAVSEANGDEIDPKNPGECSASTSPLSARGPAAAGRRPAARGFGGWNESIDERGERGEEGLENRPPQQERAQPQVQRGHGLPVRAVPSSSGGSGLSGGGSKGHSGGSGYRAGAGSGTALAGRPRGGEKAFAPVLPGQAKSIGDAMAPWAVPAKRIGSLDADMRFGNSREALQEVSMNDLFMGLWCAFAALQRRVHDDGASHGCAAARRQPPLSSDGEMWAVTSSADRASPCRSPGKGRNMK